MSKKQFWLTTILSTFTMAMVMSGLISAYKMGVSIEWPLVWAQSFLIAWPCAFFLNLTVLPQIRTFSAWLCQSKVQGTTKN